MSLTNTTRWTGTTENSVTTSVFTAAPNDSIGSVVGTDLHYYDFIVHQTGNAEVTSDYVSSSAANGKIHSDLAQDAVSALALVLRSKLNASSETNFAKINRIVVTVDMKS